MRGEGIGEREEVLSFELGAGDVCLIARPRSSSSSSSKTEDRRLFGNQEVRNGNVAVRRAESSVACNATATQSVELSGEDEDEDEKRGDRIEGRGTRF